MIILTIPAAQELAKSFSKRGPRPIRVFLEDLGCSSLKLALGADMQREGDHVVEQAGYTLLINEELAEAVGTVTIDAGQFGFTISSERSPSGGGCGC